MGRNREKKSDKRGGNEQKLRVSLCGELAKSVMLISTQKNTIYQFKQIIRIFGKENMI